MPVPRLELPSSASSPMDYRGECVQRLPSAAPSSLSGNQVGVARRVLTATSRQHANNRPASRFTRSGREKMSTRTSPVMVIEDEGPIALYLQELLQQYGFET